MLDADEAMIEITSGGIFINLENAIAIKGNLRTYSHGIIAGDFAESSMTSKFGNANFESFFKEVEAYRDGFASPMNKKELYPNTHKQTEQAPKAKGGKARQRRQMDRRIKHFRAGLGNRNTNGARNLGQSGKAGALGVVIGLTINGINKYAASVPEGEYETAVIQFMNEGLLSYEIVMNNFDVIPDHFLFDEAALNDLANYVMMGNIKSGQQTYSGGGTQKELKRIAAKIILRDPRVSVNMSTLKILEDYKAELIENKTSENKNNDSEESPSNENDENSSGKNDD